MKSFLVGTPELRLGINEDLVVGRANIARPLRRATVLPFPSSFSVVTPEYGPAGWLVRATAVSARSSEPRA